MRSKNVKTLENLSLFCHFSGIITVFLGIVVVLLDLNNKDYGHIQIGFFVLTVGYAFVKIASKVMRVVCEEENRGL
ncbi:MAG: hypothetical protein JW847_07800 [Candidatus Omnitrophica bacterium]|nr:hypothetical protein [Candidatus Omnitrophota bacterium]